MNSSSLGKDAPSHTKPGQSLVSSLKPSIRQCSKCSKLHITNNFLICICEEKFKAVQSCHIKKTILDEVVYRTPERECSFLIFVKQMIRLAMHESKSNLRHKLVELVKLVWADNFHTYADSQSSKLHKHVKIQKTKYEGKTGQLYLF